MDEESIWNTLFTQFQQSLQIRIDVEEAELPSLTIEQNKALIRVVMEYEIEEVVDKM